jgi:thioredoxin 1
MNCPHCDKPVPDSNYKCPHCGKAVREVLDPHEFRRQFREKQSPNLTIFLVIVFVVGIAVLGYFFLRQSSGEGTDITDISGPVERSRPRQETESPAVQTEPDIQEPRDTQVTQETGAWVDTEDPEKLAKAHVPGEEIDIEKLLHSGKTTIFDFYSQYCGPCVRISPFLKRLDRKRDDIVVVKIDINRKEVMAIDWNSPVARQYNLGSIPHFVIYDSTGYRTHEGDAAYDRITQLFREEGLIR